MEDIITHYKMRSDEFFPSYPSLNLPPIDLAFIDGSHAYKDVKYDFVKVLEQSHKNTYIFLHDTNIYLRGGQLFSKGQIIGAALSASGDLSLFSQDSALTAKRKLIPMTLAPACRKTASARAK